MEYRIQQDDEEASNEVRFSPPVYIQRYEKCSDILEHFKWRGQIHKVVDFGCAELQFFKYLKNLKGVNTVLAVDCNKVLLENCHERVAPLVSCFIKERDEPLNVSVLHGSIAVPDYRLLGCDAVVCIELIEHLDADVLEKFPQNVFGFIEPLLVIITTPNSEFNVIFPQLRNGGFRHWDHRFEWTRAEFQQWAHNIVQTYPNYTVEFCDIGMGLPETRHLGGCSQMAVFIHNNYTKKENIVAPINDRSNEMNVNMQSIEEFFNNFSIGETEQQKLHNNIIREYSNYCIVADYHYPYIIDNRSREQKIFDEAKYRINLFALFDSPMFNEANDHWKIPIGLLIKPMDEELQIDVHSLSEIMKKNDFIVEDGFLIYPNDSRQENSDENFM